MKCLIIAAGKGSRLQDRGESKPLIPILGIPLIERVVRTAIEAGADTFYLVAGYRREQIHPFLSKLSSRLHVPITTIVNEEWEKGNGLSALQAQKYLNEPFLLLMADHLFDPAIARQVMSFYLKNSEAVLAVDEGVYNPLIDMGDVTRVKTDGEKIAAIGKGLTDFNGFDTGIFMCTPAVFSALQSSVEKGDATLSGAMRIIAAKGRFRAAKFKDLFWIDVDDSAAFIRAENSLLSNLHGKTNDGPVSHYINRHLSVQITRRLVNSRITPNQISMFSFLCSALAAWLFSYSWYPPLLLGGVLAQFSSVIDGCDGEMARLTFQKSDYGGWFDAVLDRYADAFLLLGLTWHAYMDKMDNVSIFIGFLAIIGSFMVSYTADKYDSFMSKRIGKTKRFRLGRDIRLFFVFLGSVFNQVYFTLAVIAVIMNIETIRRLIICRDQE